MGVGQGGRGEGGMMGRWGLVFGGEHPITFCSGTRVSILR